MQSQQVDMQLDEYMHMTEEANARVTKLATEIEMRELEKIEMRNAFTKIQEGKERELEDANLIFFAKKKELVNRFNNLKQKFEQHKLDMDVELDLKDKIADSWKQKYDRVTQELKLAKLILSD